MQLKKHAPNFRARGVEITRDRTNKTRSITITGVDGTDPNPTGAGDDGDAGDDGNDESADVGSVEGDEAMPNLVELVRQELESAGAAEIDPPVLRRQRFADLKKELDQEKQQEAEEAAQREAEKRLVLQAELAGLQSKPNSPEIWKKREEVLQRISDFEREHMPSTVRSERAYKPPWKR